MDAVTAIRTWLAQVDISTPPAEGLCDLLSAWAYKSLGTCSPLAVDEEWDSFWHDWREDNLRGAPSGWWLYAGQPGEWTPERLALLADAKKHFGVAV
jgi:hypothetical protein